MSRNELNRGASQPIATRGIRSHYDRVGDAASASSGHGKVERVERGATGSRKACSRNGELAQSRAEMDAPGAAVIAGGEGPLPRLAHNQEHVGSIPTPAIRDTAATHLRNALQIITGVVQDELRLIGYKVDGLSCSAITHEELEGIHNRIIAAVKELERDATERAGVLKQLMERA